MKNKIACATCETMCESAISLYALYHLVSPGLKVSKMGLKCPKTNKELEIVPKPKGAMNVRTEK